ncbi:uncharacterized protein LOC119373921 [Rhipicephalus sanguineus]|nr:uncharacterized protein LOC119373921 [Rhipicephalus sanguineus]
MNPKQASRFTQALTTNNSVVDLAVSDFIFSLGESDSGTLFAAYLTNENCSLKRLKLKSLSHRSAEALLPILVEAVCKMKKLEDLNVDIVTWDTLFTRTTSLFADVVARSSTLRRLQLHSGTGFSCWTESYGTPDLPVRNAAQFMEPWLKALRSPNSELNELRINLEGFGPEECHAFFEAVAENETLKSVSLQTVPAMVGVEKLCATIREFGLTDRVVILDHEVDEESVKVLPLCPEISCVTVRQKNLPLGGAENGEPISSPYDVLSRCAHVTSIRAHSQDTCDGALLSSLTAYVRGACSLTDVEVDLRDFGVHLRDKERKNLETELMSALASNNRLVSIDVRCAILSKNDMKILVDGARSSRNLTRFSATVDEHWNWRTRDRRTELNHARKAAFAEIQECVARNTSLVRAAVEFVLGDRDAVMGVRAFELMHGHPDVLRMVRERAGVTRGQARNMVANAFSCVSLCSLDDFMRMAGVVREKVECSDDQPGAGLRLTDINAYCWLHIRSFLKIGDVVGV